MQHFHINEVLWGILCLTRVSNHAVLPFAVEISWPINIYSPPPHPPTPKPTPINRKFFFSCATLPYMAVHWVYDINCHCIFVFSFSIADNRTWFFIVNELYHFYFKLFQLHLFTELFCTDFYSLIKTNSQVI